MTPVTVIGAGWAGLAAAVELTKAGCRVQVLEAARIAGGRARSVKLSGETLDNGQHLLLGACHELLRLMTVVGVDQDTVLDRRPLKLVMRHHDGRCVELCARALPAPLHLALGLLGARGLPLAQRFKAISCWSRLRRAAESDATADLTVAELLHRTGQPASLIDWIWEPLCLAVMNTPSQVAAATPFLRALMEALNGAPEDADLLFPRHTLERVFTEPATTHLQRHGNPVQTSRRVDAIEAQNGRICGLRYDGELHPAQRLIIATPPRAAAKLIASAGLQRLSASIAAMEENAISTVYLRLKHQVGRPDSLLTGLLGSTAQWCFDRTDTSPVGLLSVVVSDDPGDLSPAKLAERISSEICHHWPELGIEQAVTLRERRATYRASLANEARRPPQDTELGGLWLAGDYTQTGLPATLEGAVRSGVNAARMALAAH